MSEPLDPPKGPAAAAQELEALRARVARIEAYLRLDEPEAAPAAPAAPGAGRDREAELELTIGQDWFARVGIAALTAGAAFTLSLPYAGLPPLMPPVLGYLAAAGILALASWCDRRMDAASAPLRGAAMVLSLFAALRFCYFGQERVLGPGSVAAAALFAATAGANLYLAWRRGSPWLLGLGLATGYGAALATASAPKSLVIIAGFSAVAAVLAARRRSPTLALVAMPLAYASYVLVVLNDPVLGRPMQFVAPGIWAPAALLATAACLSVGLLRATDDRGSVPANAGIFLNAVVGSLVYLVYTLEAYEAGFVGCQGVAAAVLLGLGYLHARRSDGIGAFVCAMSGFLSLSFAILKAAPLPDVFVWLSLQSVVVVATAIWLRSRFIVVANFLIYLGVLVGYVIVAENERGISIGFGAVALATARLLGWKQERLELKTELMRNAYLAAAFVVFPYALYHLVPGAWVGLAWVGAALLYYLLAALLRNPKYRWMAHGTLLLTALYMAVAGTRGLDPVWRTLSLLVLGTVLVVVSVVFTRIRRRR